MKKSDAAGFTLFEMVVTLTIVSTVIALSLPQWPKGAKEADVHQAARLIESQFHAARNQAILSGVAVTISISLVTPRVVVKDGQFQVGELPSALAFTAKSGKFQVDQKAEAAFIFYPNGTSSGGRIEVADDRMNEEIIVNWINGGIVRFASARNLQNAN
jgi:general secretion pathway protein H